MCVCVFVYICICNYIYFTYIHRHNTDTHLYNIYYTELLKNNMFIKILYVNTELYFFLIGKCKGLKARASIARLDNQSHVLRLKYHGLELGDGRWQGVDETRQTSRYTNCLLT